MLFFDQHENNIVVFIVRRNTSMITLHDLWKYETCSKTATIMVFTVIINNINTSRSWVSCCLLIFIGHFISLSMTTVVYIIAKIVGKKTLQSVNLLFLVAWEFIYLHYACKRRYFAWELQPILYFSCYFRSLSQCFRVVGLIKLFHFEIAVYVCVLDWFVGLTKIMS